MATLPLTFGSTVAETDFQLIQTRMALDFCKSDSQIGDVATLFRQPVLIGQGTWLELKRMGEELATELMTGEEELLDRPELYSVLGLPKPIGIRGCTRTRVDALLSANLAIDFHYTTEGWRVSVVNSDVPGGSTEASRFTQRMCDRHPGTSSAGNPGTEWAESMHSAVGGRAAMLPCCPHRDLSRTNKLPPSLPANCRRARLKRSCCIIHPN